MIPPRRQVSKRSRAMTLLTLEKGGGGDRPLSTRSRANPDLGQQSLAGCSGQVAGVAARHRATGDLMDCVLDVRGLGTGLEALQGDALGRSAIAVDHSTDSCLPPTL